MPSAKRIPHPEIPDWLFGDDLNDHRLAFPFAALGEPGTQAFGESLGGQAKAGFEFAVGDGKGIVEVRGVGEVRHAELVKPIKGAGAARSADDDVDLELLGVHAIAVFLGASERGPG